VQIAAVKGVLHLQMSELNGTVQYTGKDTSEISQFIKCADMLYLDTAWKELRS